MVDFYQIGALLYELLIGLPPNYNDDKQEMFNRIANVEPQLPDNLSSSAKDLLRGLLNKNPEERLGFNEEFSEVKNHPWFTNFNWLDLTKKSRFGPLKPHLSGYYFDQEYVEELTEADIREMTLEW